MFVIKLFDMNENKANVYAGRLRSTATLENAIRFDKYDEAVSYGKDSFVEYAPGVFKVTYNTFQVMELEEFWLAIVDGDVLGVEEDGSFIELRFPTYKAAQDEVLLNPPKGSLSITLDLRTKQINKDEDVHN